MPWCSMRITVDLNDDVMGAVRMLARERGESLGAVISALVRERLRIPESDQHDVDVPVFRVSDDAPPLTPEMVSSVLEG
jgi:hypothetical protein